MWYSQGTVAVTNGGTNVTGTGTSFLTNARVGDGITITGSTALHEIIGVTSNTQLSIRPAYAGTTGSGRTYGISPLLGYDKDLSDAFNQLRLQFGDQLSNLQPWATANTAQEARNQLGASSSGNAVFTGTPEQGREALGIDVLLDELRPQNNLEADQPPNESNDSTQGYSPLSVWVYGEVIYRCIDATPDAAVWIESSISASDLGSAAFASTTDFDTAGSAQASTDYSIQRANHTGTQPIVTVEGLGEALASVRIFDSTAEGRAAVENGQYYYVDSDDPDVSRQLWQRIDADNSELISEDPSLEFVDGIGTRIDSQSTRITRINDQVSALNIERYIGDGPLYPWAVDQDGKMLGWFDSEGTGFANIYTLLDPENPLIENLYTTQAAQEKTISRVNEHVSGLTLSQYVGDGPMYPWAVDSEGNILGWFNEDGTGFANIYTLIDPQNPLLRESQHLGYGRDLHLVQYQGNGETVPIVVDSANQVLLGFDASSGQMVGSFSAPSGSSTQTRVVLSDRLVTVYMKGSTPSSNIWLEHTIKHDTDLTLDANSAYDVWHSSEIWECSRLGDTFTRIRRLVLSGETECAIYERLPPGGTIAPDAIGGSIHGMEYLDWAYLLVDGVPRELDDYGTFDCETLSMAFQSRLYRYNTGSRDPVTGELDPGLLVAMKNTKWQFKRDSRILYNTLTFEEDMLTNRTLLAMFSVERDNAASPFENLTNTAYRSPTWAQEDVSSSDGFPTLRTNTDEIMLSGDTGISASVAILNSSPEFPNASAYVTNRAQYNKIYFNVTGDRVLLNAGDVLSITAEYKINSTN